ncbi:MAG: ISAzo13 family transposase [Bacteroidales bacterium]|nr:ISAzo13 family transposase [Bacteroidales bacterium]
MFQAVIMVTNNPSDIFTEMDLKYIDSLDERQKRHYLATRATSLGRRGVSLVSRAIGTDRKTTYRGIHELKSGEGIPDGHIRHEGGGRTPIIDKHPEYVDVFHKMVDNGIAGLPQDEDVRWLKSPPSQISGRFKDKYHIHIGIYIVKQLIGRDGYRFRKPFKSLPMRECKDRDGQFNHIFELREQCPIQLGIDTKKKEQVGNFRRDDGRVCSKERIRTFDHDFGSFGGEPIIPHGILDINRNSAYMTFGTSHDTSEFACDCIAGNWESSLRHIYPNAKGILLLCDGGGSSSSRGWLFKWELIKLAKRIKVNIREAHYPPYCSKWNPIEHMIFSQITRVWKGEILNSVELARDLAAGCRTKTGLAVFNSINRNVYETNKERVSNYEDECRKHIVYDAVLPKWNYVVKWAC